MKNCSPSPKLALVLAATATLLLGACSEKPQTAGTHAPDQQAWNGSTQRAFDAPGWKPGDKASWDEQINKRNRSQNEFVRMGK